jgi:leader peptidase (prepilin peptidase)/N-methyltransferase
LTFTEANTAYPRFVLGCAHLHGALVGSFHNVVIHRLPIMLERQWREQANETLAPSESREPLAAAQTEPAGAQTELAAAQTEPAGIETAIASVDTRERYNLVTPRSRCPKCNAAIKAHQNIPVVSWLLLGGRCASCRAPISARYPVVELATAMLSVAVVWRFGWHWQSAAALLFTWSLIALTVIDIDHQLLPDIITLPLLWIGLLASLAYTVGLKPPLPVDPRSAILGAVAGYTSLWLVFWAYKLLTGKEGMGYGDFKLFGAIGAWLGWQMLLLVLLVSAFAGAVIGIALMTLRGRDRSMPIPFGPYLAAAAWIALMWGPQLIGGYLEFSIFNL